MHTFIARLAAVVVPTVTIAFGTPFLYAQNPAIELTISSSIEGEPVHNITAGVHSEAHNCLDKDLGEDEVPLLPPAGLFPVFILPKECDDEFTKGIMTRVDLREIPAGNEFVIDFELFTNRESGETMIIRWDLPLAAQIDSATLRDPLEFAVPNIDMKSTSEIEVDNEFVNRLFLKVWFKMRPSSVEEPSAAHAPLLFPNPVEKTVTLHTGTWLGGRIDINSMHGLTVYRAAIDNAALNLDLSGIAAGIYYLRVFDRAGQLKRLEKLVKQ